MLRFDFELDLLEGKLAVKDLPEAWRERFQADFGIVPPDDRDGVLQDVHWYGGTIGGSFQGYTLGNILGRSSLQPLWRHTLRLRARLKRGNLGTLHDWLKENIYQHGSKYTAPELIERVTGRSLRIEPYIHYLRSKYGELYSLR